MSVALARSDPRRLFRLEAMGIAAYALRSSGSSGSAGSERATSSQPPHGVGPQTARSFLAIICAQLPEPRDCEALIRALGIETSSVNWLNLEKDALSTLPKDAGAYLVLGPQLARVVGAELPTATQQNTPIVVVDAPSRWRGDAMAKRLCWQALRPLARALRASRS